MKEFKKELKWFICEVCNTAYLSAEHARICESRGMKINYLKKKIWLKLNIGDLHAYRFHAIDDDHMLTFLALPMKLGENMARRIVVRFGEDKRPSILSSTESVGCVVSIRKI